MAFRAIILYADHEAALRQKSSPVRIVNRRVKKLVSDLKDTLLAHPECIGLAPPQINVHHRVIVVRLDGRPGEETEPEPPLPLINPEILEARDERRDFDGCLSFPGLFAETVRPHYLRVSGLDERGRPFERVLGDFDAVLVHHEIDHLYGVLFIDRVERQEDLFRVQEDERGQLIRVPLL